MAVMIENLHCDSPDCPERRAVNPELCLACAAKRRSFNPPEIPWQGIYENALNCKLAGEQQVVGPGQDAVWWLKQLMLGQSFILFSLSGALRKLERLEVACGVRRGG